MINERSVAKLIELHKSDRKTLDFIRSCLDSFEQYHRSVFEDQLVQIVYGGGALDGDEYRERRTSADRTRTVNHNSVIMNVGILNRMAEKAGIEPVYDGTVSEERPYRRQVADAVFAYIESVIKNRS